VTVARGVGTAVGVPGGVGVGGSGYGNKVTVTGGGEGFGGIVGGGVTGVGFGGCVGVSIKA